MNSQEHQTHMASAQQRAPVVAKRAKVLGLNAARIFNIAAAQS